eukprot:TRINITY_DN12302_c0_g1_i1.p1 TRINITY_DN12302_c0_g1~~TRINITY_DN12302_c0_g1_i1.p1  ORF type:complete len:156 (-),score=29.24 TRINITY_DN12302_c0_g1_i1:96-563(-)
MPKHLAFDRIAVICEGFDSPDDPFVLVGSCGIEYSLKAVGKNNNQNRNRNPNPRKLPVKSILSFNKLKFSPKKLVESGYVNKGKKQVTFIHCNHTSELVHSSPLFSFPFHSIVMFTDHLHWRLVQTCTIAAQDCVHTAAGQTTRDNEYQSPAVDV